jgi:FMN phosphatase YigB (HAD superfamily)
MHPAERNSQQTERPLTELRHETTHVVASELMTGSLGATPRSVLFIDDRAENVQAATALGLQAVRFTSAAELPGQLDDWETRTR